MKLSLRSGKGEIRTHGRAEPYSGFQDRRLKPLGHPSNFFIIPDYSYLNASIGLSEDALYAG